MPKNSAHRASEFPISGASKLPYARADTIRSASRGDSGGNEPSVTAFAKDRLAQARLVVETQRCHHRAMRVHRADQTFTLQHHPDRRIAQSGGVAGRDHGVAEVEMIAM